jgi:hypothetical protein
MPFTALARWSLRVVLALSLVVSGMAVGADAPRDELPVAATSAPMSSTDSADLPCHGMDAPDTSDDEPCDCCPQRSCDTTTCAFAGCVPVLLPVVASIPLAAAVLPGSLAAPPSTHLQPPLRPPIG